MNGADLLIKTAVNAGVEVCFANPGTTELPLVKAMDDTDGMRGILCLFEGVCTGAADGYARMKGKPAATLLHLGPGLANGIANLHNAARAGTPLINIVGEHATWHLPNDPPLAMEIAALSGTVSGWHRSLHSPGDASRDMAAAYEAAMSGKIATLVVPHDYQSTFVGDREIVSPEIHRPVFDPSQVEKASRLFAGRSRKALFLGGEGLSRRGLEFAARIASVTGCELVCPTFPARVERGIGLPDVVKIPYLPEKAIETLMPYDALVFAGAREPVTFFGYEGVPGRLVARDRSVVHIADTSGSVTASLRALADALGAPGASEAGIPAAASRPEMPSGKLDSRKVCAVLAALQPEGAIVVDESITSGMPYFAMSAGCPPFTYLSITAGAIGQGPPSAAGAAAACPDRPVISLQADGSAMYTIQALWTQARENLDVTTLLCNNRGYGILKMEFARAYDGVPGRNASLMTDLGGINWVQMGEAHGVASVSVRTAEELADALETALAHRGPDLIEMQLY